MAQMDGAVSYCFWDMLKKKIDKKYWSSREYPFRSSHHHGFRSLWTPDPWPMLDRWNELCMQVYKKSTLLLCSTVNRPARASQHNPPRLKRLLRTFFPNKQVCTSFTAPPRRWKRRCRVLPTQTGLLQLHRTSTVEKTAFSTFSGT